MRHFDSSFGLAFLRRRSLAGAVGAAALLATFGLAAAHEDDPKVFDRLPAHHGRAVRTSVATGMAMAAGGTPRAFDSSGVTLLSHLPLSNFGNPSSGNDCWGYTSAGGREIAIFCHSEGTGFVDITDPRNPTILGNFSGPSSLWRDPKVYGNYAYVVSEGGSGIQVFNLANVDAGQVTLVGSVTTGGVTSTHNVAIDTTSGFLYRCGGSSNVGLRIYDLNANPTNPPFVAQWLNLYVHDTQVVTYPGGRQIAFCCAGTGNGSGATRLSILDVTNKANIVTLKEVYWPTAAYSHQCWISEDRQYCYIDDELDEPSVTTTTYVVEIGGILNATPQASLVGSFTNGNTAVNHNLYVKGDRIFCANYRSGLRVFDRTNPVNCTEVAYFDTFPGSDSANFNGLWSVYPFFASGAVIGSDLESGLFVWYVGDPQLDLALVQAAPSLISPTGETFAATVTAAPGQNYAPGTARLHYDAGAGVVSVPLVELGGGQFDVPFPALACGSRVSWYLSAEASTGMLWTEPEGGAASPFESQVATGATLALEHTMETNPAWIVGDAGDNATSGVWTRVNPNGTSAQPEDDHSAAPGVQCWVTGQGSVGGSIGENDVDGGVTTLRTAVMNLAGLVSPQIGYWRWYVNDGNTAVDDSFVVQITNGGPWVTVESIDPGDAEASGGWYYHEFAVADFVTPNASVQMRFRAADAGSGSIVEAAIDDFVVRDVDCSTIAVYCTAGTTSSGCNASISSSGVPSASTSGAFTIAVSGVEGQRAGLVFYGVSGALASPWVSGSSSFLCVKAPTQRTSPQLSGGTSGACDGSLGLDWNQFIATHPSALGAPFSAGEDVWSQAWFRDPPSPGTTSLSNALRFTVGP
jgi:choice-of-anchor B domain-containing protein